MIINRPDSGLKLNKMRIKDFQSYGFELYANNISDSDKFELGDVVINSDDEIGVIIQVHGNGEYRSDMSGNCCESEIRLATEEEISKYRPNIKNEGQFKHYH